MKESLLVMFLVMFTYCVSAQNKEWSVEANYPVNVSENDGDIELNGIIDLGIKYRFMDLGAVQLGAGLNTALLRNEDNFIYGGPGFENREFNYQAKQILVQPKLFAELAIPGLARLKPQIALGYTVAVDDYYYNDGGNVEADYSNTNGGLNLNLGISYDLSSRFFIQVQYDYLNVHKKGEETRNDQTYSYDFKEKIGLLKAGLGFRF
ncbi:outer membrane beta-barrel protein [Maribacter confluentis]|uniref:Outer membrane beta-barrel protein n=1 Tax=Maribacter confluentis TaxID=1656093 RepID=A0ABT8RSD9_9FLAO|nr:outer membrane beta-barrel protein [Maribacter confluentis]MDO1513031.1 outer membrane beta-barrel protein [Maribacter confluentis]